MFTDKDFLKPLADLSRFAYNNGQPEHDFSQTAVETESLWELDRAWHHWGIDDAFSFKAVGGKVRAGAQPALRQALQLSEEAELCLLAFRGTMPKENWITDLNFGAVPMSPPCQSCQVHGGFLNALESFETANSSQRSLTESLDGAGCGEATLALTGHSLGGAIAQLAAVSLAAQGRRVGALVAFESPTVGNEAFKTQLESLFADGQQPIMVTNGLDPVPQFYPSPRDFPHMDFPPLGTEVHYTGDEKIVCARSQRESCPLQLLGPERSSSSCEICGIRGNNVISHWRPSDHCRLLGPDFPGYVFCGPRSVKDAQTLQDSMSRNSLV